MKKILFAFIMLFMVASVHGETLALTANGGIIEWSNHPNEGVDNYLLAMEYGGLLSVDPTGTWVRDLYALQDTSFLNISTLTITAQYKGFGQFALSMKSGDTIIDLSTVTVNSTGYADLTYTSNISPFTGTVWTMAEVNLLQVGMRGIKSSSYVQGGYIRISVEGDNVPISPVYVETIKAGVTFKMGATVK